MADRLVDFWLPARGAPPSAWRFAGGLYLAGAISTGVVIIALLVALGKPRSIRIALLPGLTAWLIGVQLVLWGGFSGIGLCGNWGRVALTAIVGYTGLAAIAVLLRTLAALLPWAA